MQVLKITNIPIKYEMKTIKPHFKEKQLSSNMQASARPAQINIEPKNIKVNINTKDMRNSLGRKDAMALAHDATERGGQAALAAAAQLTQAKSQMAEVNNGVNIPEIVHAYPVKGSTAETDLLPGAGAGTSWEPNCPNIQYTPAEQEFDFEILQSSMEFVRGSIVFEIKQYPRVEIEYVGDPIYSPPSSNPDFKEKDSEKD